MEDYYKADPQNFNGTAQQKKLVIGGEGIIDKDYGVWVSAWNIISVSIICIFSSLLACMWGEYNDNTNVLGNLWPTASTVGERLWSSKNTTDFPHLFSRLFEMQCRMIHRGIPATPVTGPGYCDKNWAGFWWNAHWFLLTRSLKRVFTRHWGVSRTNSTPIVTVRVIDKIALSSFTPFLTCYVSFT